MYKKLHTDKHLLMCVFTHVAFNGNNRMCDVIYGKGTLSRKFQFRADNCV